MKCQQSHYVLNQLFKMNINQINTLNRNTVISFNFENVSLIIKFINDD